MIVTGKTTGIVAKAPAGVNYGITSDGGHAFKLTNKTGGVTVKGYAVEASATVDNAFILIPNDRPDVIGIIFGDDDGNQVADGEECWIVYDGLGYVYSIGAASRRDFIRTQIAVDGGSVGQCVAEPAPTSPFAIDKHFQEIGHTIEATGGAGLVLCAIHRN